MAALQVEQAWLEAQPQVRVAVPSCLLWWDHVTFTHLPVAVGSASSWLSLALGNRFAVLRQYG